MQGIFAWGFTKRQPGWRGGYRVLSLSGNRCILETFSSIGRKDEQAHGEYRTKRVILDIYDAMQHAMETGAPYHTRLNPPPAHGWTPPEITLEAVTARQDDRAREDTANVSADVQRRADAALSQPAFHFDDAE